MPLMRTHAIVTLSTIYTAFAIVFALVSSSCTSIEEVEVTREVPVTVQVEATRVVEVPATVEVEVTREIEIESTREVPVTVQVEATRVVEVPETVEVEVTREVQVEATREVPVEVTREVPVTVQVEATRVVEVPATVEVEVTREIEIEVTRVVIPSPTATQEPAPIPTFQELSIPEFMREHVDFYSSDFGVTREEAWKVFNEDHSDISDAVFDIASDFEEALDDVATQVYSCIRESGWIWSAYLSCSWDLIRLPLISLYPNNCDIPSEISFYVSTYYRYLDDISEQGPLSECVAYGVFEDVYAYAIETLSEYTDFPERVDRFIVYHCLDQTEWEQDVNFGFCMASEAADYRTQTYDSLIAAGNR